MQKHTLNDYFKRFRAQGKNAQAALESAREALAAQKSPWLIPVARPIEYNQQTESGGRWIENVSNSLRLVGFADEINRRIGHRGWYGDDFGHEVYRGVVYRLPSRNGKQVFAYGYADPYNNDCAYLVFDADLEGEEQAARYADQMAERVAEEQREYSEAWQAGSNYAAACDEVKRERKACLALLVAMRKEKQRGAEKPICDALRQQVQRHIVAIREARKQADGFKNCFMDEWRKDVWPAFNDGAGETVLA